MVISKIGAKVVKVTVGFTQSRRRGKFFFLDCCIDFERKNLLSEYSFAIVISVHTAKSGHSIRYIK